MTQPLRVLVASHGHPAITNGGAELAAFRLFQELDGHDDVEAWFLGCNTQPGAGRDGIALTQPYGEREYIYATQGQFNWFRFANTDSRLPRELEALLRELRPDVVHLHHYVNFGVEALMIIRRTLPDARIVITLHEYLAICNHFGQMVKRGHFSLCDRGGRDQCHRCYPEIAPSDFFLRERYIKLFFDQVDHFVSPSQFLANRYADWGLEKSRLSVIGNIIAAPAPPTDEAPVTASGQEPPVRIGFFGQISKLKGIGVLLDCAEILDSDGGPRIAFEIYGDYTAQPAEFQEEFLAQLGKVSRNVNYHGAYRQDQVDRLMRGVDAVLVPSIWWENAPTVIDEAFRNERPVICSNIGGMAEKVRDGVDGFQFPVGSGLELSYLLTQLCNDRTKLKSVRGTVRRPAGASEILSAHLALYNRLSADAGGAESAPVAKTGKRRLKG